MDVAEGAAGEGVAFDVVDAALLDLASMRARPTRAQEKPVVLGALAIAALDFGIVEGRMHDRGPEIIELNVDGVQWFCRDVWPHIRRDPTSGFV